SGGVRINGSTFIPSTFQTDWETAGNTGIIQGSVIVTLNGGETLDLALQATDDVPIAIILAQNTNATLTVKRLSPFP
ncbi:MAG: collagen-like protein, partial [Hungatella sp.]|nr:collagen-like protein [Hungatella sp.]